MPRRETKTEVQLPACPRCGGQPVPREAQISGWWRYECQELCGFWTGYYKRKDAARRGWRRLVQRRATVTQEGGSK